MEEIIIIRAIDPDETVFKTIMDHAMGAARRDPRRGEIPVGRFAAGR